MSELPDPFVPATLDLRDFRWMKLDLIALFNSDFNATIDDTAWRAGVTLWGKAWHQVPAGSLPNDDAMLCNLAGLGRDVKTWKKIRATALHGFKECSDGRLYHRHLCETALEAHEERERWNARKARDKARKSGGIPAETDAISGGIPPEIAVEGQGQGEGQGDPLPLANANGRGSVPVDVNGWFPKHYLANLCKQHGDETVFCALTELNSRSPPPVDPKSAIVAYIKTRESANGTTRQADTEHDNPVVGRVLQKLAERDRAVAKTLGQRSDADGHPVLSAV